MSRAPTGPPLPMPPPHPAPPAPDPPPRGAEGPPVSASGTRGARLAAAAGLVLVAIGTLVLLSRPEASDPQPASPAHRLPARVHLVRDGLRYDFDALTGRETLVEVTPDGTPGRSVLETRPAVAREMRRAIAEELGIDDLDRLIEAHKDAADALRRLGYL